MKASPCTLACVTGVVGGEPGWAQLGIACRTSNFPAPRISQGGKFTSPQPPVPVAVLRFQAAGTKPLASIGFISGLPAARSGVPVVCFGDRQPVAKTPLGPPVESGGALAGPVALETVVAQGLSTRVAGSACCWLCSQKKTSLTCSSFKLTSFLRFISSAAGFAGAGLAVHAVWGAGFVKQSHLGI